ncbi:hypothetical protein BDV97DRAFT_366821 [Delphinella strobiligena]|nr:hypothetical protein BDV97DRAFT_366821 [Delphinella strobiligena]
MLFLLFASMTAVPASALAASFTTLFSTDTTVVCPSGISSAATTCYTTSTIHALAQNTSTSVIYVTPNPVEVFATTTVTSTSVVPTSSGFLPVIDTFSTVYADDASNITVTTTPGPSSTPMTCTNYETIFTTQVQILSDAITSTLARPTLTSLTTEHTTVPFYAACGTSNLLSSDPITGAKISDLQDAPLSANHLFELNATYQPDITTAYDCCAGCIEESSCVFSWFYESPTAYDAHYNTTIGQEVYQFAQCAFAFYDTCDVASNYALWLHDDDNANTLTISNGNCGFLAR